MKIILKEKSIESFNYTAPKDPELLLYDFYFIIGFLPRHEEDPTLKFVYDEAYSDCVNNLTKHMVRALKWSLSAELRHVFDPVSNLSYQVQKAHQVNKKEIQPDGYTDADGDIVPEKYISEKTIKFIMRYQNNVYKNNNSIQGELTKDATYSKISNRRSVKALAGDDNEGSRNSTYAMNYASVLQTQKEMKLDNTDLGIIMREIYNDLEWNSAYGGKAWGKIANALVKLTSAESLEQKTIWIDHAYDLQHNTGSVFTKVKLYTKNYSMNWIVTALDWKRDATNITQFFDKVSPQLKYVVAYVSKNYYSQSIYDKKGKKVGGSDEPKMTFITKEKNIGENFQVLVSGDEKLEFLQFIEKLDMNYKWSGSSHSPSSYVPSYNPLFIIIKTKGRELVYSSNMNEIDEKEYGNPVELSLAKKHLQNLKKLEKKNTKEVSDSETLAVYLTKEDKKPFLRFIQDLDDGYVWISGTKVTDSSVYASDASKNFFLIIDTNKKTIAYSYDSVKYGNIHIGLDEARTTLTALAGKSKDNLKPFNVYLTPTYKKDFLQFLDNLNVGYTWGNGKPIKELIYSDDNAVNFYLLIRPDIKKIYYYQNNTPELGIGYGVETAKKLLSRQEGKSNTPTKPTTYAQVAVFVDLNDKQSLLKFLEVKGFTWAGDGNYPTQGAFFTSNTFENFYLTINVSAKKIEYYAKFDSELDNIVITIDHLIELLGEVKTPKASETIQPFYVLEFSNLDDATNFIYKAFDLDKQYNWFTDTKIYSEIKELPGNKKMLIEVGTDPKTIDFFIAPWDDPVDNPATPDQVLNIIRKYKGGFTPTKTPQKPETTYFELQFNSKEYATTFIERAFFLDQEYQWSSSNKMLFVNIKDIPENKKIVIAVDTTQKKIEYFIVSVTMPVNPYTPEVVLSAIRKNKGKK